MTVEELTVELNAQLDHIAIAVEDLSRGEALYAAMGMQPSGRELIAGEGVEVSIVPAGGCRIELLQPTGDDTPVGRFIKSRGAGLHHIALRVPDMDLALQKCREAGIKPVDASPHTGMGGGLIAFLHPRTTGGVLIELIGQSSL